MMNDAAAGAAVRHLRPHQHHDAGEAERKPGQRSLREPLAIRQQPLDQRRPERRGRDQHRRQSARDELLRVDHEAVADDVHQEAKQGERRPQPRLRQAAPAREHQRRQHHAGRHPSQARDEQHRNGLERDVNRQIGRAPDDADGDERDVGERLRSRAVTARSGPFLSVSSLGIAMRGSSFTVSSTIVVLVDVTDWRRGDLLPKDLSEMLGIARADLQQVAIVARDVMDFEDFRNARELVGRRHVRPMLRRPHRHERQHAAIDDVRVDQRDVILDNALRFELPQAFEDGRGRQPNGLRKLGLGGSGVVLKNIQN